MRLPVPGLLSRCRFLAGLLVAGLLAARPAARAEGIVTTNSTAAFLNALGGGGRVQLNFPGTLPLEIPLVIAADTVLEGASPNGRIVSISGADRFRLFQVLPGIRFEVRNLVLRDGLASQGAAILNEGILVASNVTFMASSARGADGAAGAAGTVRFGYGEDGGDGWDGTSAEGGAILNLGEATFVDCLFDGNEAEGGAGGAGGAGGEGGWRTGFGGDGGDGAWAYGGAIASSGTLAVTRCQFVGNSAKAGDGGAGGGTAGAAGAGQGGAGAGAAGGAIHSSGLLSLVQSSFTTNVVLGGSSAPGGSPTGHIGEDAANGGPAFGGALASWSTGVVVNVTFYTNLIVAGAGGAGGVGSATYGDGGNGGDALGAAVHARGRLDVNHATLVLNFATNGAPGTGIAGVLADRDGSPGRAAGSALAAAGGSQVTLRNSILAAANLSTVDGPVVDAGSNLFTDSGTAAAGPGSIRRADPLLSAFQVWTSGPPGLLPLSGSPAVDAADPAASPGVDQRGLPRPAGRGPDIGAMEVGALSYMLEGQVLDGAAGVVGVRIEVGSQWMLTDSQGRFRFGPLATGFYTVAIAGGGIGFTPRLVQVPLVADATNVVFRTTPLTLQFQHDPQAGANRIGATGLPSRVYRLEGGTELGDWQPLGTAEADNQGRFQFEHAPGTAAAWFYRVVAPAL